MRKGLLSSYTKTEKRGVIFAFALLAFPIAQFLVFYLYINIDSFRLAFFQPDGNYGWANFERVFREFSSGGSESLLMYLVRSIITWCASTFITFPISILFTYALFKKVPGEMVFRIIFFLPSLLGAVIMTTLFRYIVSATGPLLEVASKIGLHIPAEILRDGLLGNKETTFITILFYGFWVGLSSNIIVLTGALTRIPKEIFEASKLDGTSFMGEFFRISLPLIWPTISTLLIFTMAGIFVADAGTFLLIGTGSREKVYTIGYYMFYIVYMLSETSIGDRLYGYPAALGLLMTVITIPIVLTVRGVIERFTDDISY